MTRLLRGVLTWLDGVLVGWIDRLTPDDEITSPKERLHAELQERYDATAYRPGRVCPACAKVIPPEMHVPGSGQCFKCYFGTEPVYRKRSLV